MSEQLKCALAGAGPTTNDRPLVSEARRHDRRMWSHNVASDVVHALEVLLVAGGIWVPALIMDLANAVPLATSQILQSGLIAALLYHLLARPNGLLRQRLDLAVISAVYPFTILSVVFLASLGLGIPVQSYGVHLIGWYATWLFVSIAGIVALRLIAKTAVAKWVSEGRFDRRIAIYGGGTIARRVHDFIQKAPGGFVLDGIYDDRSPSERMNPQGLKISGDADALIKAGRNGAFDQIIIALPQSADRRIAGIASRLEQLPTSLHVVTHIANDIMDAETEHAVSSVGPVGLLDVKPHPHADWAPIIKRAMDLTIALAVTIPLLPLMALIAVAVKLDSSGPVFFRQRRRGFNHSTFEVVKFRTMNVLEDGDVVRQAQSDDKRVTRVGWFLRRASLDELPQLWNVLRGEMSLVGPRPHAVAHDDAWGAEHSRYVNRNQVKPGITGLAQIAGARGEISEADDLAKRVEADLNYIANWSPWLDLKIIVGTAVAVLGGRNAH